MWASAYASCTLTTSDLSVLGVAEGGSHNRVRRDTKPSLATSELSVSCAGDMPKPEPFLPETKIILRIAHSDTVSSHPVYQSSCEHVLHDTRSSHPSSQSGPPIRAQDVNLHGTRCQGAETCTVDSQTCGTSLPKPDQSLYSSSPHSPTYPKPLDTTITPTPTQGALQTSISPAVIQGKPPFPFLFLLLPPLPNFSTSTYLYRKSHTDASQFIETKTNPRIS
ncbi:hypothetical protein VUR80DRAFT_8900 [Thermomyces stellatus]